MTGEDQRRDREERHEPHAPYEWHEPMHDEQEHTHTHAGNRTVNHGPDELGPEETAQDGRPLAGHDSDGKEPAGTGPETSAPAATGSEGNVPGGTGPEGDPSDGTGPEGSAPGGTGQVASVPEGAGSEENLQGGTGPEGANPVATTRKSGTSEEKDTAGEPFERDVPNSLGRLLHAVKSGPARPGRPAGSDADGPGSAGHASDSLTPDNSGPDDQGPLDGHGADGLAPDELELRALLHGVVQDVRPRDGALEHLRRAVPARRARKRQALVGMAAAALFAGTAVPALLHVSDMPGLGADPSIAGSSSQAHNGTGQGKNPDGGASTSGGSGGRSKGGDTGGGRSGDKAKSPGSGSASDGGASASASPGTNVPLCAAAQLGSATSAVAGPDSAGIVYGTFRVVNVSGEPCTVDAGGAVQAQAQGAADSSKISVVQHASGDAATGLPDPSAEASQLVLQPGAAYEVRFAWVPSETCPTSGGTGTGGTGGASPDPSPSTDTGAGTGTGTGTGSTDTSGGGTAVQMLAEDGTADGSVVVAHTAAAGSPTVSVSVPDACAGTVYRTGLLAGS